MSWHQRAETIARVSCRPPTGTVKALNIGITISLLVAPNRPQFNLIKSIFMDSINILNCDVYYFFLLLLETKLVFDFQ